VRVLLSSYGSRGDVEPVAALAVRLRELGAEARVCAPPDQEFEELLTRLGVPFVPFGRSVRELVTGERPPSAADARQVAAELVDAWFGTIAAAAEDCDALVATGLMPAGAPSVAEKLGIRYVCVCLQPIVLPSPHRPPPPRPGPPFPPGETDNRVLWELDARKVDLLYGEAVARHRAAIGLPPVTGVRDHVFTRRPWLAADPLLAPCPDLPDFDVVRTGAWVLPDERPLPAELVAFLDAGTPPVYVGFGSMPMRTAPDVAAVAVEAVRAQGRRTVLARGWAELGPVDGRDDRFAVGEVSHRALFGRVAAVVHHGGAGTTTRAALAGAPQVVVPQIVDQPYWAARVAGLGIGAAHDGPVPTLASLSASLGTALAPATAARAKAVAGAMRTDGTTVAARLLLDTVNR
jgi:vancomycin aglycone glucosyltransferase